MTRCHRHSSRPPSKLSSVEMSGRGYLGTLLELRALGDVNEPIGGDAILP